MSWVRRRLEWLPDSLETYDDSMQLFDRSGMLYGELARFVLRMLGIRTKPRKALQQEGPGGLPGPAGPLAIEGPKADGGAWDGVWGAQGGNGM